ncbi:MAG: GNAT family N-acetyltransferase [Oscillospiraceae bacterium]|nr:GNAT family N-acetyltransferase [Oscillospiraceae bacterium]
MVKEKIIYRILERDEIRKLNEIDRYEIVEEVYYFKNGKLVLEKEYREIIDISDISGVIEDYIEDYDDGGTFIGAFDGEKLVGLSGIGGKLIGENKDMIQLTSLWVSNKYRKKGIGRQLISMLKEKAKQSGAKKLYVSAMSSKNTVDFYCGSGFDLTTPVKELFEDEPKDIHMDMLI